MKKALIVLLLLAFVAGGLFAQFSLSGRVDTGLAIFKAAGNDDVQFGLISKQLGANGIRGEINFNVTNEAGNAGLSFRLRSNGDSSNFVDNLNFRWAYGWIKAFDGLLEVRGGRIQGSDFDTLDNVSDGATLFDSYGLMAYVTPVDMFKIGVGAYSGTALGSTHSYLDEDKTPPEWVHETPIEETATGWAGFGIYVPDVLDFVAQMDFGKNNVNAWVSVGVTAIPSLDLILTAGLDNLTEFSDAGTIGFYEQLGFNGIENLGLGLSLGQSINQAPDSDLSFAADLWVNYAMGSVTPRLDLAFGLGAGFVPTSFYFAEFFQPAYAKDMKFMAFIPSVQLQVASNCFVDLGFFGGIDIGDIPAFGGADTGFSFGAFLDLYVRF